MNLMDKSIKKATFAECYKELLYKLLNSPEYSCSPRGMTINEITDCSFVIENPLSCLYSNERRSSQEKYIAAEFLWYFSGRRDLEFIQNYASFWKQIANQDGTLNSAYGHLIFDRKNQFGKTQWEWAYDSLVADKDTRQAIMHFNTPDHQWNNNKDFVCTLTANFHIRENRLNLTIIMRSNDAILGTATDVAFFCIMQAQMFKLLKLTYPDLKLGTYTHFAHSLHIYERHFNLVKEMLEKDFVAKEIPMMEDNLVDKKGEASSFIKTYIQNLEAGQYLVLPENNSLEVWIAKKLMTGS
jgi:thymidylate synthase